MNEPAQVKRGAGRFACCVAAVLFAEAALAAAALIRDWTLSLTGVGRVAVLLLVARWALTGRRWGRVVLAAWVGSQAVVSALGAALVAFVPDLLLRLPHTQAVWVIPPYYWALPAVRLAVFLAAGLALFRSPDVTAFWEERRGRRTAAMSPLAWACLATAVLAFVAWAAVNGIVGSRLTGRRRNLLASGPGRE
jgi:hypothetical protein